jgi:hypothetical protein
VADIYPKEMRSVRDLARKRSQLVRTRTMHVLAVENLVARQRLPWRYRPNVMVMNAVNDVIAQIE